MKLQPESKDHNSNNRDRIENGQSLSSDPLQDLYDLLGELVDRDRPSTENLSESDRTEPIEEQTDLSFDTSKKDLENEPQKQSESEEAITNLVSEDKSDLQVPQSKDSISLVKENLESISDSVAVSKAETKSQDEANIDETYITQEWILEKEKQINELADSLNALIPFIVELSKADVGNSEEQILKAIVPIIDRVIQQRTQEDQEKMASAIAHILPEAIRQEIKSKPESIGRAIAPEIALSIKEQTNLSEGAIAQALGSEMGKAIKKQIETERDAMVDALYPVIGSTISKYMTEVVESINAKVDAAFSPQGIQRKIRARMRGVSEAELILQESLPYSVKAIFLIHKNSGLVISELQVDTSEPLESDLLAGMLTAIRSFANDCIVSDSELGEIDYDSFKILLETAGYCYMAVVVNGEPDQKFRDRLRNILSQIVMKYSDVIENYRGDPTTVPESMQSFLETLIVQEVVKRKNKHFVALWWLIAFLFGTIFVPWGMVAYRGWVANTIEKSVAVELDANPELSVYRLTPEVKKGQLSLTGRVPSIYLRNLAATVSRPIATEKNITLNNQIIAVDVPADPSVISQEVARLTKAFNQNSESTIDTAYRNKTVTIDGLVLDSTARQNLIDAFENIPGVEKVILVTTQSLPKLDTRIYFPSGSSKFSPSDDAAKIAQIVGFLQEYPSIKLKVFGHSDRKGNKETNLKLARERAEAVTQAIIDRGISSQRLEVTVSLNPPPGSKDNQPLWLSRCVRFESLIAEK